MSQGVPTGLDGQIESPNPFEVFWEKNKIFVIVLAVLAIGLLGGKYVLQYMDRKATDEKWSKLSETVGLSFAYLNLPDAMDPTPQAQQAFFLQQYMQVTDLERGLKEVDVGEMESYLATIAGDKVQEPLVLWALSIRLLIDEDYEGAKARLNELKSKYSGHFLCKVSDYPPQIRDEVEDPDEDPLKPKRDIDREWETPVAGSPVDLLIASIDSEVAFKQANRRFFDAPEPDSKRFVEIVIGEEGDRFQGVVKVGFFEDAAPEHIAKFLELVNDEDGGFFDGVRVHEINRASAQADRQDERFIPSELKFGLEVTKEDDDRANWTALSEEELEVDWEDNDLSHFPGMVAAERAPGKAKSQINRIVINTKDAAALHDGTRVIFGKVVEGLDLIQRIIDEAEFQSESDDQLGRGAPIDDIRIMDIRVVE